MLLDEIFEGVSRTKKVWVRADGQLRLVTTNVKVASDSVPGKPLFPISKPRYPDSKED